MIDRYGRPRAIKHQTKAPEAAGLVRSTNDGPPEASKTLLDLVLASLDDDKAEDVVAIDLSGKSTIADFMVVATGRSSRHVGAMAEHLREKLKRGRACGVAVEGAARADWVLIDGGDVIVHLFRPEVREFYALEKMWGADLAPARPATPRPTTST